MGEGAESAGRLGGNLLGPVVLFTVILRSIPAHAVAVSAPFDLLAQKQVLYRRRPSAAGQDQGRSMTRLRLPAGEDLSPGTVRAKSAVAEPRQGGGSCPGSFVRPRHASRSFPALSVSPLGRQRF